MLTRTAWQPNDHADIASKRLSTYLLKPLSSHWNIGRPPGISIFPCPWPFFPVGSNSSQSVLLQHQLIFSMLFSGVLGSVYPEVPSKGMPGDIGKGLSVKVQLKKKTSTKPQSVCWVYSKFRWNLLHWDNGKSTDCFGRKTPSCEIWIVVRAWTALVWCIEAECLQLKMRIYTLSWSLVRY